MPEVTDGALRAVFFLSFLGRMVSELGLVRILPLLPAPPTPTATWGIELTVSVSTVMFLVEPSPAGFPLPTPAPVLCDFVVAPLGRGAATGAVEADLILISPFPPLSLPLSLATVLDFDLIDLLKALSTTMSFSVKSLDVPFSPFSSAPS